MPLSVSCRTCDWTQKTESVQLEQTKDAQNSVSLEEWGEQEKKWWEDRSQGFSWACSADHSSWGATGVLQGQKVQEQRGDESNDSSRFWRASHAVDLEAGQLEPLSEPLPLERKHGILAGRTRSTLYRDTDLSRTVSSLEDAGHENPAIWSLPSLLYPPRQPTNATETTSTTSADAPPSKEMHSLGGCPDRPTKRPLFAWLPSVFSQSGSRPSSILEDAEKDAPTNTNEYTSNKDSLGGIGEDILSRQVKKRLRKRLGKEKRKIAGIYVCLNCVFCSCVKSDFFYETTKHVAEVPQRQEFMLKFARAHLMLALVCCLSNQLFLNDFVGFRDQVIVSRVNSKPQLACSTYKFLLFIFLMSF